MRTSRHQRQPAASIWAEFLRHRLAVHNVQSISGRARARDELLNSHWRMAIIVCREGESEQKKITNTATVLAFVWPYTNAFRVFANE